MDVHNTCCMLLLLLPFASPPPRPPDLSFPAAAEWCACDRSPCSPPSSSSSSSCSSSRNNNSMPACSRRANSTLTAALTEPRSCPPWMCFVDAPSSACCLLLLLLLRAGRPDLPPPIGHWAWPTPVLPSCPLRSSTSRIAQSYRALTPLLVAAVPSANLAGLSPFNHHHKTNSRAQLSSISRPAI